MGYHSNLDTEIRERDFGNIETKVCHDCVGNKYLKSLIKDEGQVSICSYCGSKKKCIDTENFIYKIMNVIKHYYENAEAVLVYENDEYQGASTIDTHDLLEQLNNKMQLNENLLEELKNTIDNITWAEINQYGQSFDEIRMYSWARFCEMVKTESRYVFFRLEDEYEELAPIKLLDYIASQIEKHELITTISQNSSFFRCRVHKKTKNINSAKELGAPPPEYTKANRMNAEGVSVFYGAEDVKTALLEGCTSVESFFTTCEFKNKRDLTCIDLTKIQDIEIPSYFDLDNRKKREVLLFLNALNLDLTKPIEEMKNIEYVPNK